MNYKHIIFDVDGTLIDTKYSILHSLQELILQLRDTHMPLEDLTFALGITGIDALKRLDVEDLSAALLLWDQLSKKYQNTICVFEGMKEVLLSLRSQSYQLGIITSRTIAEYEESVIPLGLDPYFDLCIRADDTITHKPTAAPMNAYLAKAQVDKSSVLYIGDSIYDMQCAKNAGADCALALWGCHKPEGIEATYYLKQPTDLLLLLS